MDLRIDPQGMTESSVQSKQVFGCYSKIKSCAETILKAFGRLLNELRASLSVNFHVLVVGLGFILLIVWGGVFIYKKNLKLGDRQTIQSYPALVHQGMAPRLEKEKRVEEAIKIAGLGEIKERMDHYQKLKRELLDKHQLENLEYERLVLSQQTPRRGVIGKFNHAKIVKKISNLKIKIDRLERDIRLAEANYERCLKDFNSISRKLDAVINSKE